ncbi:hypothetical protein [Actinomycetospora straminea]|uniref:Uncharacterized protein n=1 Tax=Actinomycetospora straminea TaxID=663607 RepID=A0ABP9EQN5_9PSEU|nr:hypothetical protein [Actinomycetospora straminea]MDD7933931.1 hypothetical protein [Actinomycetospora straminea]
MTTDSDLERDIVDEARDDWIDLLHVVALVKIVEGGEGRLSLLHRAGPLVVDLVRQGRLLCGEPSDDSSSFDAWTVSADEAADILDDYVRRVLAGEQPIVPGEPCSLALPERVTSS